MRNTSFENLGMPVDKTDEYESRIDKDRQVGPGIRVTDRRGQNRQSEYHERVAESLGKAQPDEVEKDLEELIAECFMNPGPGRVVVKPDVFKYRGRMVIPDESKRSGTTGVILKVGYGCNCQFFDDKLQAFRSIRAGDKVAYGTWTGTQFRFDQRPSYRILSEDEIATLLTEKATKLMDVEA